MNPPTIGHQKLVHKVVETAKALDADHVVYLSFSQNNKTDPLEWAFKRRVCQSAFHGVNISTDPSIKNPYTALESLKEKYNKIVMIAGSDQVPEYTKRFSSYARDWGVEFEVVSAGERLVESTGVEGISATKMRQLALENDRLAFYQGAPSTLSNGVKKLVFENTKKALKFDKNVRSQHS